MQSELLIHFYCISKTLFDIFSAPLWWWLHLFCMLASLEGIHCTNISYTSAFLLFSCQMLVSCSILGDKWSQSHPQITEEFLHQFPVKCSHQCERALSAAIFEETSDRHIKHHWPSLRRRLSLFIITTTNSASSSSLWSRVGAGYANQTRVLASGFHFIADRLNEAHRERTGTFTVWQAGWLRAQREASCVRQREDCWWSKTAGLKRGYGGLATPAWSMPPAISVCLYNVRMYYCALWRYGTK